MAEAKSVKSRLQTPYRAKEYCNVHYKAWRQGEYGGKRRINIAAMKVAKTDVQEGMCEQHYGAWTCLEKAQCGRRGRCDSAAAPQTLHRPRRGPAEGVLQRSGEATHASPLPLNVFEDRKILTEIYDTLLCPLRPPTLVAR